MHDHKDITEFIKVKEVCKVCDGQRWLPEQKAQQWQFVFRECNSTVPLDFENLVFNNVFEVEKRMIGNQIREEKEGGTLKSRASVQSGWMNVYIDNEGISDLVGELLLGIFLFTWDKFG